MDKLIKLYITPPETQKDKHGVEYSDIIKSVAFFASCYFFFRRRYRTNPLLLSRYVSTVHSIILSALSIVYLCGGLSIYTWHKLQAIPIGYLLYDLGLVTFNPKIPKDLATYFHHFTFLAFSTLFFPKQPNAVTTGYLSEVAVPFMNSYFHWRTTNPQLARSCGAMMLILWPFCRIINFSLGTYVIYSRFDSKVGVVGGTILSVLNIYWFWKALNKLKKR
jgi:hypothetical protein